MVTINELKRQIEELGYLATEELIYDTFNALCMFQDTEPNPGQDIFAICLEGPPGAGKTEFAKTYTKLSNQMFNNEVEMVDYQCDATTGKTELFEDINISAAIRGDADNVNIPGKLVEAIKKVNEGKKVVLFIDEYDKAREETDAFLLQFLQSGKINSTQHGDLEIKKEYKSNLQVILCKNDMREELSGPLSRRIRIIRLDYMEPMTFYKVAHRTLIDKKQDKDKVNDGLLNLVTLMYQNAYNSKEMYNRLPSCSEMLIAIKDANRLMTRANAPKHIIYNTIIRNMFKSLDDIKTFESSLNNSRKEENKKLKNLIDEMKKADNETEKLDLNSIIAQKVFTSEGQKLTEKTKEMQKLIETYKSKFAVMEERRKQIIEAEVKKILLENGKLVSNENLPSTAPLFEDESAYVKRGHDILKVTEHDWVDIGEIHIQGISQHMLVSKLIEYASKLDITIYENGIMLKETGEQKIIVISEKNKYNVPRFRLLANEPVIPSTYISDIINFINFAKEVRESQPKTSDQLVEEITNTVNDQYSLNVLIYNDKKINLEEVEPNVYTLELSEKINEMTQLSSLQKEFECSDINNPYNISKKIMSRKAKVLTHE